MPTPASKREPFLWHWPITKLTLGLALSLDKTLQIPKLMTNCHRKNLACSCSLQEIQD